MGLRAAVGRAARAATGARAAVARKARAANMAVGGSSAFLEGLGRGAERQRYSSLIVIGKDVSPSEWGPGDLSGNVLGKVERPQKSSGRIDLAPKK